MVNKFGGYTFLQRWNVKQITFKIDKFSYLKNKRILLSDLWDGWKIHIMTKACF